MRTSADVTNVVEACNTEGRQERLENMLSQLELCEKALQVCSTTTEACPWEPLLSLTRSTCKTHQHASQVMRLRW